MYVRACVCVCVCVERFIELVGQSLHMPGIGAMPRGVQHRSSSEPPPPTVKHSDLTQWIITVLVGFCH